MDEKQAAFSEARRKARENSPKVEYDSKSAVKREPVREHSIEKQAEIHILTQEEVKIALKLADASREQFFRQLEATKKNPALQSCALNCIVATTLKDD